MVLSSWEVIYTDHVLTLSPTNHGNGKRLHLKGNYYWRDPFFTSMIMGRRALISIVTWKDEFPFGIG